MRVPRLLVLLLALSLAPVVYGTPIILVDPLDQTHQIGDPAAVDVVFSNPEGNRVGAFSIGVSYDPVIVDLTSVIFGTSLGGGFFNSIQDASETPGAVEAAEISLLFDLSGLQDGVSDVLLFSLVFNPVGVGASNITLSPGIGIFGFGGFVADEFGFTIDADALSGSISVIPEPISISLVGAGLVGLFLARRRKRA